MATHGVAGVKLDCERIRKEAVIFQQLAPSGLAIYEINWRLVKFIRLMGYR